MSLVAFIWDFDGTLADTRLRNYRVVRRLIEEAAGTSPDTIPALASRDTYDRVNRQFVNWRELYTREFGFSEEETDRLGRLWEAYQLRDETPVDLFAGVTDVLSALELTPHGIVSQNARAQIARTLDAAGITRHFGVIVGCEEVHIKRQKPEPDGLLACLKTLSGFGPGRAVYIGDHETDVRCARNAAKALAARGSALELVSLAVQFTGTGDPGQWAYPPDYVARSPREIIDIARGLGAAS